MVMEIPPGIDPTESKKTLIYAVISGMLGVAFVSLCLRLYTRAVLIKQFGWDDGAAIFAFVRQECILEFWVSD